jgi:uncharacterized protein (TIGR02757 family)
MRRRSRPARFTPERVSRLAEGLARLEGDPSIQRRTADDPIEFPKRYATAADQEVAGLLATSLAYGRVDLFKPKVDGILRGLGPSPSRAVAELDVQGAKKLLDGFVYRFNVAADLAVLLLGAGALIREHGSLEQVFLDVSASRPWRESLSAFAQAIRDAAPRKAIERSLGKTRGLAHLLPVGDGAAKRLSLYLRWMARPADGVDLGAWPRIGASRLVIPLDTHVARVSKNLGLTRRRDLTWKTAEEITVALRNVDPHDPVRFDFVLCHLGMSQRCPRVGDAQACRACPLLRACTSGTRRVGT